MPQNTHDFPPSIEPTEARIEDTLSRLEAAHIINGKFLVPRRKHAKRDEYEDENEVEYDVDDGGWRFDNLERVNSVFAQAEQEHPQIKALPEGSVLITKPAFGFDKTGQWGEVGFDYKVMDVQNLIDWQAKGQLQLQEQAARAAAEA